MTLVVTQWLAWGPRADAATATFGNTTVGSVTNSPGAGYKFGSVYNLSQPGTTVSFSWYTHGGSSAQDMTPVIYNVDSSGNPSTFVAQGSQVVIAANRAAGWVTSTLPSVSLGAGGYLLGLMSGPAGSQVTDYLNTVTNGGFWNANTYGAPTSAWGAINHENSAYSFYVTYTPTGSGGGAPSNTSPPTISGTPRVGQTLTSQPGQWTNSPTGYAYQWQDCNPTGCTNVANANAATYTVATGDIGYALDLVVTAKNGSGSASASSAQTATVANPSGLVEDTFDRVVIDASPPGAVVEKALGDILGNGKLDAVIGTETSPNLPGSVGGIYWYQYPASGNPADTWVRHTILSSGTAYEDMAAYDVDGDGKVDIIASVNNNLYWFKNPGTVNGTWTENLIGAGKGENTLALADIDGDGKIDIATNTGIYFQNTPYSWTRKILSASFSAVALLDIGSGRGSINLVGNGASSPYNIVWYENPRETGGNARTGKWKTYTIGPGYYCSGGVNQCNEGSVASVTTADLNADGRIDVVVGQSEGSPAPPGGLKWYQAPVDRTQPWTEHDIDPSLQDTHDIKIGDMNGDGTPDIVTGEQDQSSQKRVVVLYNDGRGNFTEQVLSNGGTHNVALGDVDTVGDVTGGGHLDILAGAHGYFGGPHPLVLFVNEGPA